MKLILQLALCCILSVVGTLSFVSWQVSKITGDVVGTARFIRVMSLVKNTYYGELDNAKLMEGALKGMVEAVNDPYTTYLNKKEYAELNEMTEGTFGGIGIVFGKKDDKYVVVSALEDNPGMKAGIKGGEVILAVDGKSTQKMSMDEVAKHIRGEKGTEVKLTLQDEDGSQRTVSVIRADIKHVTVAGKLLEDSKVGYIRIAMFSDTTSEDFGKEFKKLEEKGMQALILDLRGNPGGTLKDGVGVARYLVPKGPIVSMIDKNGKKTVESSELEKVKYPLAVLINGGTASAAEIVSGAVKDTDSGRLFGTKSFGKGCVQNVYRLGGGTGLKVTMANYYTPSGNNIHNIGIEPHEKVEQPKNAKEDLQLKAAKEYLFQKLQAK